jgi:hypothetical protein
MKSRQYIQSLLVAALLMAATPTGCTTDETVVPEASHSVNVTLTVDDGTGRTRAESTSSNGVTPNRNYYNFFFVDKANGLVVLKHSAPWMSATYTFSNVPSLADRVYVVTYYSSVTPPSPSPDFSGITAYGSTESDLLKVMIEIAAQVASNPADVNTFGYADIDLHSVAAGSTANVTVKVAPAVSRLEIEEIDPANPPASLTINKKIATFDLDAIYINNTYTKLALDSVTKPTIPADIVQYGGDDAGSTTVWGSSNPSTYGYPAVFYDVYSTKTGQGGYTAGAGKVWAYYLPPLAAATGTTINSKVQDAVPHIVLKLSNITMVGSSNLIAGPMFLTVKKYVDEDDEPIEHFKRGTAYVIENLAFGVEHLSVLPEESPSDYTIRLVVQDWENRLLEHSVN